MRVPVVVLRLLWVLDGGVTEELPDGGVVMTTVYMDEAYVIQRFVPCEAMTTFRGDEGVAHGGAVLVAPLASGVVASAFRDCAGFVSQCRDRTNMVCVEITRIGGCCSCG